MILQRNTVITSTSQFLDQWSAKLVEAHSRHGQQVHKLLRSTQYYKSCGHWLYIATNQLSEQHVQYSQHLFEAASYSSKHLLSIYVDEKAHEKFNWTRHYPSIARQVVRTPCHGHSGFASRVERCRVRRPWILLKLGKIGCLGLKTYKERDHWNVQMGSHFLLVNRCSVFSSMQNAATDHRKGCI